MIIAQWIVCVFIITHVLGKSYYLIVKTLMPRFDMMRNSEDGLLT